MFKKTTLAAAVLGLALTAAPAFAKDVMVRFHDLDLSTAEGQKTLAKRLNSAARDACGYNERVTGSLLPSAQSQACYKQARAKAKDQMAIAIDNAANGRLGG